MIVSKWNIQMIASNKWGSKRRGGRYRYGINMELGSRCHVSGLVASQTRVMRLEGGFSKHRPRDRTHDSKAQLKEMWFSHSRPHIYRETPGDLTSKQRSKDKQRISQLEFLIDSSFIYFNVKPKLEKRRRHLLVYFQRSHNRVGN